MQVTLAGSTAGENHRQETEYAMLTQTGCKGEEERDRELHLQKNDGWRERERKRERKRRKSRPAFPQGNGEIGSGQSLCLNGTDYCLSSSCQVTGKASIILTFSSFSYHKKGGKLKGIVGGRGLEYWVLETASCLFVGVEILGDLRKLGCWPCPGVAGCLLLCRLCGTGQCLLDLFEVNPLIRLTGIY